MAIINEEKKIMKINFLSDGYIYVPDIDKKMRLFNDPRDLLHTKIGYLEIIDIEGIRHKTGPNYEYYYTCRCTADDGGHICNNEIIRSRSFLLDHKNDETTSCGCQRYKYLETDIKGNTYNELTVIEFDHWEYNQEPKRKDKYKARDYYYICECTHGRRQIAKRDDLISYHIKGCQCTYVDHSDEIPQFKQVYNDMITRCYNPNCIAYRNYGGRGIKVCDEWKNDFLKFKEDMYESYKYHVSIHGEKETTIERIDVNKGYSKDNCRWATNIEQIYNRRCTRYYNFNGNKYTINDFLNYFCDPGFTYELMRGRLRSCKNLCENDTIINPDIFINKQYREAQKAKGLSYPIHFTTDVEKYKMMELPTTFNYTSKQEAFNKDNK